MSKSLYLANVGRTIFMDCSNSQVIGMADTLTQATFNLTVQEEELRGGPGNPLLASTFHDQSMELSFTDALISTDMIGAMIGATNQATGKVASQAFGLTTKTKTATTASSTVQIDVSPVSGTDHYVIPTNTDTYIPSIKEGQTTYFVCYARKAEAGAEWFMVKMAPSTGIITALSAAGSTALVANQSYCVKFFAKNDSTGSRNAEDVTFNLNADFVPSVLHSVTYIDVYEAGVAGCQGGTGTSTGKAVGQLIIDIPLFQLNNGLNLSLSTTPGTYDISGKALAAETSSCEGGARTFGSIYYCKTSSF